MKFRKKAKKFVSYLAKQLSEGGVLTKDVKSLKAAFTEGINDLDNKELQDEVKGSFNEYFQRLCKALEVDINEESESESTSDAQFPYNLRHLNESESVGQLIEENDLNGDTCKALLVQSFGTEHLSKKNLPPLLEKCRSKQSKFKNAQVAWLEDAFTLCGACMMSPKFQALQTAMDFFQSNLATSVDALVEKGNKKKSLQTLYDNTEKALLFFHWRHQQLQQDFDHPKYEDLLAASLSSYVDLACATISEEERVEGGAKLCSTVLYLLKESPSHVLDVLLQTSVVSSEHHQLVLPLFSRVYRQVSKLRISSMDDILYTKNILTLRKMKKIFPAGVEHNDVVAAPENYLTWIGVRAPALLEEMPNTSKFKGMQITLFLLNEASDDLVESVLDVLTADPVKDEEREARDDQIFFFDTGDQAGKDKQPDMEALRHGFVIDKLPSRSHDEDSETEDRKKAVKEAESDEEEEEKQDGAEQDSDKDEDEEVKESDDEDEKEKQTDKKMTTDQKLPAQSGDADWFVIDKNPSQTLNKDTRTYSAKKTSDACAVDEDAHSQGSVDEVNLLEVDSGAEESNKENDTKENGDEKMPQNGKAKKKIKDSDAEDFWDTTASSQTEEEPDWAPSGATLKSDVLRSPIRTRHGGATDKQPASESKSTPKTKNTPKQAKRQAAKTATPSSAKGAKKTPRRSKAKGEDFVSDSEGDAGAERTPLPLPPSHLSPRKRSATAVFDFHTDSDTSPLKFAPKRIVEAGADDNSGDNAAEETSGGASTKWKKKILDDSTQASCDSPRPGLKRLTELKEGGGPRKRRASLSAIKEEDSSADEGLRTRTRTASMSSQEGSDSPSKRTRKTVVKDDTEDEDPEPVAVRKTDRRRSMPARLADPAIYSPAKSSSATPTKSSSATPTKVKSTRGTPVKKGTPSKLPATLTSSLTSELPDTPSRRTTRARTRQDSEMSDINDDPKDTITLVDSDLSDCSVVSTDVPRPSRLKRVPDVGGTPRSSARKLKAVEEEPMSESDAESVISVTSGVRRSTRTRRSLASLALVEETQRTPVKKAPKSAQNSPRSVAKVKPGTPLKSSSLI